MLNKEAQSHLIRHRLLDPPADGEWGALSFRALQTFQKLAGLEPYGKLDEPTKQALQQKEIIPLRLENDFASNIIRYMLANDYWVPVGPDAFTIVYVEGIDRDGTPNNDAQNLWNDRRIVIEIPKGKPTIVGNWAATSEPGNYYTHNRMNPKGVARIKFGQYRAWAVGLHGSNPYEALEQCREILVYRDDNEDYVRIGDKVHNDASAVNQHHGYDAASVDANSAGCMVGQSIAGHWDFMDLIKSDRRYTANNNYVFYTAIIPGNELR
jgi:hypothetical protein